MLQSKPLVSATITTWNGERYLREAINSALMQDYPNLEIVVVDDGSTDGTEAICRSYGDQIRYYRQPKDNNNGVDAYIRTLAEARGKYVSPLDHDDRWLQGKISRQVDAMEADPTAGVVFTRFHIIDEMGVNQGVSKLVGKSGDVFHMLLGGNRFCHASAMYRPDVLAAVGGVTPDTGIGDWDMWLRIARKYPVIMLDEPLTEYRIHNRGYSTNLPRMAEATRKVLEIQIPHLHPNCPKCKAGLAKGMRTVAEAYLQNFHIEARKGSWRTAVRSMVLSLKTSPAAVLNKRQIIATLKSVASFLYA